MNLTISGHHLDVTPALRSYVTNKLDRITRHFDQVVDVRVILASNQSLEDLVARGEFRQDLYYRINVVKIELPPLRDRIGDIPHLAEHFLDEQGREKRIARPSRHDSRHAGHLSLAALRCARFCHAV